MNYELVKKLKDTGFKQRGRGNVYIKPDGTSFIGSSYNGDWKTNCYIPTLHELIEACGDKFDKLINGGRYGWFADSKRNEENFVFMGGGTTPEEAVANLWLYLNS